MQSLYKTLTQSDPESITPIEAAASTRRYFRISGPVDCVATIGRSVRENQAFIYLSRYFSACNLPVPEILAVSEDFLSYLQTDAGNRSLYDIIARYGSQSPEVQPLLDKAVVTLAGFNYCLNPSFDTSICYPRPAMDTQAILYDLNYFKYCFLKPSGIEFDEDLLQADFDCLATLASENPEHTLMLRDFQSRNIMVGPENRLTVIDFQGARLGDGFYDLASFAWQARAGLSADQRHRLVELYISSVTNLLGYGPLRPYERLNLMLLIRTLQVLGAYGFRGMIERKAKFISSIPAALATLREVLHRLPADLPELHRILSILVDLPKFSFDSADEGLTVTVMSFSYKNGGYPDDFSGNGGGFVFDCRGMHNPGRYDEYKPLTGRDRPVIDFLEEQGEIQQFMANCYRLVDPSVETYLRRDFSSLMICFGCTGGRHRSVYGADRMARHLNDRFGVRVRLIHREQGISEILPPH